MSDSKDSKARPKLVAVRAAVALKAPPPKKAAKPKAKDLPDLFARNWENILDKVRGGQWVSAVAKEMGVSGAALVDWIQSEESRAHAIKVAETIAAEAALAEAEMALRSAATPAQISKARDLAVHLRWVAARRDGRRFGDKVDVTSDGKSIARPIEEVDDELRKLVSASGAVKTLPR